jgi:hypothetical protein
MRSAKAVWFSTNTSATIDLPRILFDWARSNHARADEIHNPRSR